MKSVYLVQTYKNPGQIYRLIQTIKKSSPESFVLVSHNFAGCNLDVTFLRRMPGVNVISAEGGRGNFALVQAYLEAIEWLLTHDIEFDWLTNITGQDYPTQPLAQTEAFLAETQYDGFIEHFDVLANSPDNLWGRREGSNRYLYEYWRSKQPLALWQRALIKLPRVLINHVQPYIRVNTSYGLMVGTRTMASPFNESFRCYAGSYFHTISRKCVQYLHDFSQQHPELISYYQKTCLPDESYIHTVLANNGQLNLCHDPKRYIDWTGTRHGHPRLLTVEDYPKIITRDVHFARKFDLAQDSQVLDMLDTRIFPQAAEKLVPQLEALTS